MPNVARVPGVWRDDLFHHAVFRLELSMLLHGIFPPITTPFYPDGNVYYKKLESNVERYSRTPVAGIVVLGSTGEAIMLSDQERRDVFKTARETAAPNKVLIAGTGVESAIETLRLTEYAAEAWLRRGHGAHPSLLQETDAPGQPPGFLPHGG